MTGSESAVLDGTVTDSTVLLLDGRAISSLAAARRFAAEGVTVHVGETFAQNLTAYSSATTASHTYPDPEEHPDRFKTSVRQLADRTDADLLLPARDITTTMTAELQQELPASTATLLGTPAQVEQLQDKGACATLAARANIPIPETYDPAETGIDQIRDTAEFPVVIKPTKAAGARGIRRVDRPAALADEYRKSKQNHSDLIVQEFVDHSGGHYSIGTVFDQDGAPTAIHAYEELRQYPDSGGPAIHARSIEIEPWVHELLALLEVIDWTGPAHMDVLFDPDDRTYKLLEVNPRLWSSMALTIDSGVDIPMSILRAAHGVSSDASPAYDTDLEYRWVLPNELLWAVDGWNTPNRLRELLGTNRDGVTYSILSRPDPQAIIGTALQSGRFLLDAEKRAQIFNRGCDDEPAAPSAESSGVELPSTRDGTVDTEQRGP